MSTLKFSYVSYSNHTIDVSMRFSQLKALFKAIRDPKYIHSRTRQWCMQDSASIYHRDSTSPSGKIWVAGGADPIVAAILRRCSKTSPLSPTEML
jgi:hypothetical protein